MWCMWCMWCKWCMWCMWCIWCMWCTYVRMYVCTYVRMYVCTYVRMYVRTYACAYCIEFWRPGALALAGSAQHGGRSSGEHKPGRIKRAALSLQNQNYYIFRFLIRPRLYAYNRYICIYLSIYIYIYIYVYIGISLSLYIYIYIYIYIWDGDSRRHALTSARHRHVRALLNLLSSLFLRIRNPSCFCGTATSVGSSMLHSISVRHSTRRTPRLRHSWMVFRLVQKCPHLLVSQLTRRRLRKITAAARFEFSHESYLPYSTPLWNRFGAVFGCVCRLRREIYIYIYIYFTEVAERVEYGNYANTEIRRTPPPRRAKKCHVCVIKHITNRSLSSYP